MMGNAKQLQHLVAQSQGTCRRLEENTIKPGLEILFGFRGEMYFTWAARRLNEA